MGKEPEWKVKRRSAQQSKSALEVIETLTNEEIQKARGTAERIAASSGFYAKEPRVPQEEYLTSPEVTAYE